MKNKKLKQKLKKMNDTEEENTKLKEDLKKARGKKLRREYKKVSNIGGEK